MESTQEIDQIIDSVSKKFGYDKQLSNTLKRIVPHMAKGKSDEVRNMIFDTLVLRDVNHGI